MIMRIWRGSTVAADADQYLAYLRQTGLHDYEAAEGNLGSLALRRPLDGGLMEFVTVSFWKNMSAVRGFAGSDPEAAVFYEEDQRYLVDADPAVRHYEVEHASWPDSNVFRAPEPT